MEAFPDVVTLAESPLSAILKVWENLGYYGRARHLHAAAQRVVERHGGRLPDSREELESLPGIGSYTAGALLSMAFHQAVPAIDGNVRRVVTRLFAVSSPLHLRETASRITTLAASLVPERRPGDFNQALMDLGAEICLPRTPLCPSCPLHRHCRARATGMESGLPVPFKRPPLPHRLAAGALLRDRKDRLLMTQRPAQGLLGGLWGLPTVFVPEDEDPARHLRLWIEAELGHPVQVGPLIGSVRHVYTHFRTTLHTFDCRIARGNRRETMGPEWGWVCPGDVQRLPLAKIDRMALCNVTKKLT
jgi:A/G-specific adenine glycosylase